MKKSSSGEKFYFDPSPKQKSSLKTAYAALDLGTNTCRLLIVSPKAGGRFHVLDSYSQVIRLGEGVGADGALSSLAMTRAIDALKICQEKLSRFFIIGQRFVATHACRIATNSQEFITRIVQETGLQLEILDEKTEAQLAVKGCGSLIYDGTKGSVLFDIGGGSTQISLLDFSHGRERDLAKNIVSWVCLPVGIISLSEKFKEEEMHEDYFSQMTKYVYSLLCHFPGRDKLSHLVKDKDFYLLGTSGTATTLASMHMDLRRYDRRRVDGMWLTQEDLNVLMNRLLCWDLSKRRLNPSIGKDRAEHILSGCAILEAIRIMWPSSRIRVADRGLREGILQELLSHSKIFY